MEELDRLLDHIERQIDLDRCAEIDDRYEKSLYYRPVDRPPLVVECPQTPLGLTPFGYEESFHDPGKMMFNQLLDRVALGLELGDDSPLAIRNDHGIIQIATLFGGKWCIKENNYPWVEHRPRADLEPLVTGAESINLESGGILSRSLETLQFYREKLSTYPKCCRGIQISLPDLQGPVDTAHLLWGNDLFLAAVEDPEFLSALLGRVTDVMLDVAGRFREYTYDRLDPLANCQHTYMIPGRILIRVDTSIMFSPDMYAEVLAPHDARVLKEIGTGSIHFCGDGGHVVDPMLDIPDVRGLDLGQSEMMDVETIYKKCLKAKVAVTAIACSAEDLISGKAKEKFPTGVVFIYRAENLSDARKVAKEYCSSN